MHESSSPLPPVGHFQFFIYISKLSQSLYYLTALTIMQYFRDNEKKTIIKGRAFWILFLRFYICCFIFELRKQLLKFKMAPKS